MNSGPTAVEDSRKNNKKNYLYLLCLCKNINVVLAFIVKRLIMIGVLLVILSEGCAKTILFVAAELAL